jgi:hypothetical protein
MDFPKEHGLFGQLNTWGGGGRGGGLRQEIFKNGVQHIMFIKFEDTVPHMKAYIFSFSFSEGRQNGQGPGKKN